MAICGVEEAVEDIRQGRMIILVDDEDRENEGDITIAAEHVTPEAINFMAKYARGLICLPLGPSLVDKLDLPLMTQRSGSKFGTSFTVSIEARNGVTTGISAADRARTILAAVADDVRPEDLVTPGHVFPLRAQPGGVLTRAGPRRARRIETRRRHLRNHERRRDDGPYARSGEIRRRAQPQDRRCA